MRYAMCMLLAVACGPSSSEVKTAKAAEYQAPAGQVFDAALDETQSEYTIGDVDPANGRFATKPQFFAEDGTRLSGGPEGVVQNVHDHAKLMHLVVEVKRASSRGADRVTVVVTPKTFEMIEGSPKPRELAPDDPNLPPWVRGRVDSLALKIYHRLSPLAAKGGAAAQTQAQGPAAPTPSPAAPAPEPVPAPPQAP